MPDENNGKAELQAMLDQIFNAKNWRDKVTEEMRNTLKLRRKAAALQKELDELKAAAPKDGAVVLAKADHDELVAFRTLNLTPADLTKSLSDLADLRTKDTEREEEKQFGEAGEALGYQNIPALTRFLKRERLALSFKDTRIDDPDNAGKKLTVKLPFVRAKSDDKAPEVALDEYVQTEVPEFEEIFLTAPESDDDDGRTERTLRSGVSDGVIVAGTPRIVRNSSTSTKDAATLKRAEDEARASGTYGF